MDDQVFMSFNRQVRLRDTGLLARLCGAILFLPLLAVSGHAQTVTMTVDAAQNVKPISRYIYGINHGYFAPLNPALNLTLRRMGGNRLTAYNWENNASNAGSDFIFQNDDYLGGGNTPGGALVPPINDANANSAALLLTVPINGYVAADKNGGGDVRNSGANYLQTRFRQGRAVKGAAFTLTPDTTDPYVYQDEFVNWVKTTFPYSQQAGTGTPIWFSLDNEPDLWQETHLAIHPDPPLYSELVSKSTSYAGAIKTAAPNALVFGPVSYGWYGYVRLQGAPDAADRDFLDFYLSQMKTASDAAGKRLLDVLDLHWYPEAESSDNIRITGSETTATVVAARLQAPRSLWDSTYVEHSWITEDWIGGPINLLPLLAGKIATNYPGTKLAFTEYNYGAGQHISGGIAQADVLGIFGRHGVFAATQWPLQENADGTPNEPFVGGAFRMYRNFDGSRGSFGDTSIHAQTSNTANTSVYASLDSTNAKRMVLVVINKTATPITAVINLNNAPVFKQAAIYQLTGASALPVGNGTMVLSNPAQFSYNMAPYSVSTLNLTAASSPHDFDGSGKSDIAWRDSSGNAALWLMNGGSVSSSGGIGNIPAAWSIVGQRDFDGDGKHDLLWRDTSGNTAIWFLNGLQVSSSSSIGNVPTTWTVVGTADFDGDGKGDILWRSSTGVTAIWLMNGTQVSSSASIGTVATAWSVVGTADFNGDGKADILWRDSGGNTAIWFLNGAAVSSTVGIGIVATTWTVVATGDFNGDGKADILWRDSGGNTAIWFMNGAAVSSAASIGLVSTGWSIRETGDFNGDGKADILWRDTGGNTAIWFMNGTSVASSAGLGVVPTSWTIQGTNAD
jgi:hypothetical protein